ncbi:MAG: hypothetical protein UY48_C0010G0002 [Candidatus Gottesmanbacteria bacterium GW2011_GWB1_49_7]|uniref:Uncharacterized protein n=1 Tax=Candidatus Gottesmanbacteria bacterium GW2011_GWB1_49_7 TaxID=1618448 RepID=A0A0G1W269_9BACT|nr:MAG: hypothetical protein UY48_C0010G0002 [Candidatus Gottesmanbacteria bacterium GW2011_GWB1_49_7]
MAEKEPYDYLALATADVDITLAINQKSNVIERSRENTVIHTGDDESEERIILSSTPVFFFSWDWTRLTESDAGTILDLYHTSAQGRGKSFKCVHLGHTYVVRFDIELGRSGPLALWYGIPGVRLKVLGRIADA